ncbi:SDR family NAD(P)-dependent oxidoreductase [Streptomyces sp. AD681]|uniref:SDR family NAD(P)-dependent oxidoreductase n=1 Tax=Streptomyces sp. AD681 TaxID=3019069 RepID=UPI0022F1D5F6|nr:SDR family oxidoreductase [Streptomyces sp. AD681]MDA5147039.1 SDR family NAD(P)-dependent oxidoreductase [Streptomyces sp. AD681]
MTVRDYDEFDGTRVVVTGAAGIFGTWIAEAFAAAGADLLLTDARSETLATLAKRLGARHFTADLSDPQGLDLLGDALTATWPAPDVLVNNAGLYPRTPVATTGPDTVRRILDVNVVAPFELSRRAVHAMIAEGVRGSIVNISSGAATRPGATGSVYAASKAALETLTRSMALEVARHGIRINTVQPGFAPGSEVNALTEDHVRAMRDKIPLGRTSGPDDAPAAVLWLASQDASFVTGTTLAVDGGRTAGDYTPPSLPGDGEKSA